MRRLLLITQFTFFMLFNFFLLLTVYQVTGTPGVPDNFTFKKPPINPNENYDPALGRLNNLKRIVDYCDSIYQEKMTVSKSEGIKFEEVYPEIASMVVRNRFYHGYSHYNLRDNFMASLIAPLTVSGLSAIVIPDDILKYPFAACSQQSIVMMEILKSKGFVTRKVGMSGKISGHFCFEVYYEGAWHFFDPDMEPDMAVLQSYNRPGVAYLASHKDVLLKAYNNHPKELVLDVFNNYYYGQVNTFPATKAIIFQRITKFLSLTIWSFFLLGFIWTRRKYKQVKAMALKAKVIRLADIAKKSPAYYPGQLSTGSV